MLTGTRDLYADFEKYWDIQRRILDAPEHKLINRLCSLIFCQIF